MFLPSCREGRVYGYDRKQDHDNSAGIEDATTSVVPRPGDAIATVGNEDEERREPVKGPDVFHKIVIDPDDEKKVRHATQEQHVTHVDDARNQLHAMVVHQKDDRSRISLSNTSAKLARASSDLKVGKSQKGHTEEANAREPHRAPYDKGQDAERRGRQQNVHPARQGNRSDRHNHRWG